MSRAVRDATRFTATSPSAKSSPSASSARSPPHNGTVPKSGFHPISPQGSQIGKPPGPPGETPKEKVARLRAEWRAKNIPPLPLWDRIVLRGRRMANTAHLVTNLGILGFSTIASGVAVYALTDMFRYNRRKKREFFETQRVLYATALEESREAVARGTARPEHYDMLENERLAILEDERRQNKRHFREIFNYLFKKRPEDGTEAEVNEVEAARRRFPLPPPMEQQAAASKVLRAKEAREAGQGMPEGTVVAAIEERRREGEKALEARAVQGGPLDQWAAGKAPSMPKSEAEKKPLYSRVWSGS